MEVQNNKYHYLQNGLNYMREGNFFDAHEDWELAWKDMNGHIRNFWQAMIQLSVGAYHFETANLTGCRNLWYKALKHCNNIMAEEQVKTSDYVIQLKSVLLRCLRKIEDHEDPLPDVRNFAATTVTAEWFDFK